MYTHSTIYPHVKQRSAAPSHDVPIVFIIDDNPATRETLAFLVRGAGWQPEEFSSAQEFLSHPRPAVPNCIVLDVRLADLSGLELQKNVSGDRIEMPFIFVTGHCDVATTVQAMKAGALEVLTKPVRNDILIAAIGQALERSTRILAALSEMRELRDRHDSLSRREQEVMALVVTGLLNKQVGFELGISEITVKAHRGHMMRKMRARSLPELVTMAARLGIAAFRRQQQAVHLQGLLAYSI